MHSGTVTGDSPTLPGRLRWDSFPDPEDRARLQPFRTALCTEFPGTAPDQPPAAGQPDNQKGKPLDSARPRWVVRSDPLNVMISSSLTCLCPGNHSSTATLMKVSQKMKCFHYFIITILLTRKPVGGNAHTGCRVHTRVLIISV